MSAEQPIHYHAGYNMPGYLPEMEPGTFANFADAKAYMIWELNSHADNLDSWVEGDCDDDIPCGVHGEDCGHDAANRLSADAEDLNLSDGPAWDTFGGGLAYWITPCAEDCEVEDEDEDESVYGGAW